MNESVKYIVTWPGYNTPFHYISSFVLPYHMYTLTIIPFEYHILKTEGRVYGFSDPWNILKSDNTKNCPELTKRTPPSGYTAHWARAQWHFSSVPRSFTTEVPRYDHIRCTAKLENSIYMWSENKVWNWEAYDLYRARGQYLSFMPNSANSIYLYKMNFATNFKYNLVLDVFTLNNFDNI